MSADNDREKIRFKVWQLRHDSLIEILAESDLLTESNVHEQLIREQEKQWDRERERNENE